MDQAVGLGQEQVEVLEGEKERALIGGVDSGPRERLPVIRPPQRCQYPNFTATVAERGSHFKKCKMKTARRGYTDRGVLSRQDSGILAQVQVKQRIGVVVA